jgi:beta-lactam-binding protein with PASTA domain
LKKILLHLALIAALSLALLFFFFNWYLPSATHFGESITVPDLRGMEQDEIQGYLSSRDLRFEITADSAFSPEYPIQSVIKQYPQPGEQVKRNRKIYLTLNQATPPSIPMPDLVDVSLKNAQLILQSTGLVLGEITYKPDLAQNAVLEQWYQGREIKPGEPINKGSVINLVAGDGLGNQTFDVPSFVNMDLEDTEFYLIGIGLKAGGIFYEFNDSLRPGTIIRHRPEEGEEIRLGDLVDLWVADDAEGSYRKSRVKKDNQE